MTPLFDCSPRQAFIEQCHEEHGGAAGEFAACPLCKLARCAEIQATQNKRTKLRLVADLMEEDRRILINLAHWKPANLTAMTVRYRYLNSLNA